MSDDEEHDDVIHIEDSDDDALPPCMCFIETPDF